MVLRPVLTAEAMREADRQTIEEYGIPGFTLMESAGRAATQAIQAFFGPSLQQALICCGKGNNGGDGLVIARQLYLAGSKVTVVHLGNEQNSTPDTAQNLQLLRQLVRHDTENRLQLIPFQSVEQIDALTCGHLLIDALLGTGLTRELSGAPRALVDWMNQRPEPVVAIDIPTGLDSNLGIVHGTAVRARLTVTMGALKTGLLINEGPEYTGPVEVAEIGIPPFILAQQARQPGCGWQATDRAISRWLPQRKRETHKYQIGMALVIAGSPGLTGAPQLASLAAARIGAGAVVCASPRSVQPILASRFTEVMTMALPETEAGTISPEAIETLQPRLTRARALLVGCGLGRHPQTTLFVHQLLQTTRLPGVIDADGLYALAGHTDLLTQHAKGRWILTPHLGEFKRLTGDKPVDFTDRLTLAQQYAKAWNCVLLLKGMPSIIASPDGQVFVNATGNPGVSSAGNGDVLAGLCAGLLAQGLSPLQAAVAAVHIGGAAADCYAHSRDPRTLLASDLINLLPELLKERFSHA